MAFLGTFLVDFWLFPFIFFGSKRHGHKISPPISISDSQHFLSWKLVSFLRFLSYCPSSFIPVSEVLPLLPGPWGFYSRAFFLMVSFSFLRVGCSPATSIFSHDSAVWFPQNSLEYSIKQLFVKKYKFLSRSENYLLDPRYVTYPNEFFSY